MSEYEYTYLTGDNVDFIEGPLYNNDLGESEPEFRIGPNPNVPEAEFCIEDSCGRFIPFLWENIGELIQKLDELQLNFLKSTQSKLTIDDLEINLKE